MLFRDKVITGSNEILSYRSEGDGEMTREEALRTLTNLYPTDRATKGQWIVYCELQIKFVKEFGITGEELEEIAEQRKEG